MLCFLKKACQQLPLVALRNRDHPRLTGVAFVPSQALDDACGHGETPLNEEALCALGARTEPLLEASAAVTQRVVATQGLVDQVIPAQATLDRATPVGPRPLRATPLMQPANHRSLVGRASTSTSATVTVVAGEATRIPQRGLEQS